LKLIATTSCYGTGNAGGIFGPSLFIGAMLGGVVGTVAHQVLPDFTGGVGAYALVGMGALFAGIVRVPLTSVIMIFEMTRDYSIIVPLMISNLISFYISYRLQKEPIYEALQHQDGLHLPSGLRYRQELLIVGDAAVAAVNVLSRTDRVEDALRHLNSDGNAWPVMDSGRLAGTITLAQVEHEMAEGRADRPLGELLPVDVPNPLLTSDTFPHVHMDHPLDMALRRMAQGKVNVLPVVGRADIRDLKAIVSLKDILQAYGVAGKKGETKAALDEIRASRRLVPGVIATGLAVLLVIGFLNYYYRSARTARADEYYKTGNELLQQGRDDEAVQQFRNALSAAPGNTRYRLALGLSLAKAQHPEEALVYLNALLKRDPENALANLGEARIEKTEGKKAEAAKLYRKAIDGQWPAGEQRSKLDAYLEFATVLESMGQRREAADALREFIRTDGREATAFAGLGDAELSLEHYPEARDAFRKALERNPSDNASQKQLALIEQVLALDPNARGLRVAQRYVRSNKILRAEISRFEQCQPGSKLADTARQALDKRPRRADLEDAADQDLTLAEDLWKQGSKVCAQHPLSPDDEALERVLAR
jgi:tetratricopeptide (TPR) repeat protein/CBS domain-containing protein